jgi:hypothetical protein
MTPEKSCLTLRGFAVLTVLSFSAGCSKSPPASASSTPASAVAAPAAVAQDLPREWIDPDTGHRIVQLSVGHGEESLYFNYYAFTANGTKMVMSAPQGDIDLVTLKTGEIEHIYQEHGARIMQTGRKTGAIFYQKDGYLYALDPATKQSRQLVKVPEHGSIDAINCDETLGAGTTTAGGGRSQRPSGQTQVQAPAARGSPAAYKPGDGIPGGDNYP